MDRNQIIGIVLITVMMIGYIFFQNTQEPGDLKPIDTEEITDTESTEDYNNETASAPSISKKDNLDALDEEKTIYTHENKDLVIEFSNYGAQVKRVTLKHYKDYKGRRLEILTPKSSEFYFKLDEQTDSRNMGFSSPSSVTTNEENETVVTFNANDYKLKYIIPEKGYTIGFNVIKSNGSGGSLQFDWKQKMYRLEKGEEESISRSAINYYTGDNEFDDIGSGNGNDSEFIEYPVKWFAHKQRFFNSGLIVNNQIQGLKLTSQTLENDTTYIKQFESKGSIPFVDQQIATNFYYGPNDYKILKKVTEGYGENVYMGWLVFSWINKFLVVPIFKFLEGFMTNYGLIIFILVVIIKLLLFPIAYKSYLSMAKMKELKPEIDAIKERVGADNMQAVQSEQMKLYNQVGVNPLSGCIPMVLQMPILLALFNFFPNSIELRQESFLWAHDLSTYDAPIQFDFNIPFLGDHISLFTLLMTLSTIAYTYYNNQMNSAAASGPYKYMGYLMPVIFFFVLNNFSSGLTYYYFISNLITISQQQIASRFIDKDKIRRTMEENKKNSGNKKQSKFQQRLQDAMKAQQEARKNQKKK